MHTTQQAAALWCPMVRTARVEYTPAFASNEVGKKTSDNRRPAIASGCNTDALGQNRVPASCRCVADQCAMWRWGDPVHRRRHVASPKDAATEEQASRHLQKPDPNFQFVAYDPIYGDDAHWLETQASVNARRLGYCGLAGSPHQRGIISLTLLAIVAMVLVAAITLVPQVEPVAAPVTQCGSAK